MDTRMNWPEAFAAVGVTFGMGFMIWALLKYLP